MKTPVLKDEPPRMLNVGCGSHYHPDWCNVDLVSVDPRVIEFDIRKGLPFHDNYFLAVYHSHVLEHLTPQQGQTLIQECQRVLQPGGVLRIVVPDLERIAQLYLETLERAWEAHEGAPEDYEWMKLELLDQMVRNRSGGLMGPYMIDTEKINREFVQSRIGTEVESCHVAPGNSPTRKSGLRRPKGQGRMARFRRRLADRLVGLLLGREASEALREGLFRQQGEIHRWMYDRYSLKHLCEQTGFCDFQVCAADESRISNYAGFQLDKVRDQVRKPDSLFVECRKAPTALARAA